MKTLYPYDVIRGGSKVRIYATDLIDATSVARQMRIPTPYRIVRRHDCTSQRTRLLISKYQKGLRR